MKQMPTCSRTRMGLALAFLSLSACVVGPDYHPPKLDAGQGWAEQVAGADGLSTPWWRSLHDAQIRTLVERLLADNPNVQASRERIRQARAQRDAAHAGLWPQVAASVSLDHLRQSENGPLPLNKIPFIPRNENLRDSEFDASWDLDLFGARRRAVESAQAQQAAFVAEDEDLRKSLVAELVREIFYLRAQQAALSASQQEVALRQRDLAAVQRQVAVGELPRSALDQAEYDEKEAAAVLPAERADLRGAALAIATLCGRRPEWGLSLLQTQEPLPPVPPVALGQRVDVLARRPDVRAAERRLAAATADIGTAKAQWFPQLSLGAAVGYQSLQNNNWFSASSQTGDIFPMLRWQIFSAGAIQAQVHLRQARQRELARIYVATVLSALADAERRLFNEQQSLIALQEQQQAWSAAQSADRHAAHALTVGEIALQERLDAALLRCRAEAQMQSLQAAALMDWVALNKALSWPI